MKKLLLTLLAFSLLVASAFALKVGEPGIGINGLVVGGSGVQVYSTPSSESDVSYWKTARTAYWTNTRVALWSTTRDSEI